MTGEQVIELWKQHQKEERTERKGKESSERYWKQSGALTIILPRQSGKTTTLIPALTSFLGPNCIEVTPRIRFENKDHPLIYETKIASLFEWWERPFDPADFHCIVDDFTFCNQKFFEGRWKSLTLFGSLSDIRFAR
jgi:hypothetical protein